MEEGNIKKRIDCFNYDLSSLIDDTELPLQCIVEMLILQAVTLALDNQPDELSGMKMIHSAIWESISYYQKYYS